MTAITGVLFLGQSCTTALPPLTALLEAGFEVPAVVLARQPGRRLGEIQRVAASAGIPVVWVNSAAEATESSTPWAKLGGVESALPMRTGSPGAKTIVSVQVPPTSVATRYLRVLMMQPLS